MATSQFTVYSSDDAGAPVLSGLTGSLVALFDACLVNGYGSKPGAGWLKPMANSASVYTELCGSIAGCWQQPAGAGMTFVVSEVNPTLLPQGLEARVCGYERITAFPSGSVAPLSAGDGDGRFYKGYVIRKASATSTTVRPWLLFADSSSLYLFIDTLDSRTCYYPFMFGDFYSYKPTTDQYRCFMQARTNNNTSDDYATRGGTVYDGTALSFMPIPGNSVASMLLQGMLSGISAGLSICRNVDGTVSNVEGSRIWDMSKTMMCANAGYWETFLHGTMQTPNGPDNTFYVSPIYIGDPSTRNIRGKFRGLYQICHPTSNFSNGQIFAGGGDYAGRQFRVLKHLTTNFSCSLAIEISNTVDTN